MSGKASPSNSDTAHKSSFVSWFTFLVGIPLGVGILYLINNGPYENEIVKRYVEHAAEQAEVIFFCCCMAALMGKMLVSFRERHVHSQPLLPTWDRKKLPVSEVTQLQQALNLGWDRVKGTYMGRRIANVLNFIESRGSVNELDDQMRILADNDAMELDGSYGLMRLINWAIPIIGFLGTVLGITKAISGISPERLENGLGDVTGGLTNAFDATALGLSLTLISMFLCYRVEKREQKLLEEVDQYADEQLSHRFVRTYGNDAPQPVMGQGLTQMLEKQVALWATSMERIEHDWSQAGGKQQEAFAAILQRAIETALTRHGQHMTEHEKKLQERQQVLLEGTARVAAMMKETSREHQMSLARLTDAIGASAETLTRLQSNETQLNRLQETLSQNLALLANSATFEQAVQSLTAAIHLLTTRVTPGAAPGAAPTPRVLPLRKDAA